MEKLVVILPVYNEETAIHETLKQVREALHKVRTFEHEIICVNDGSTDNTESILRSEAGITLLSHPVNRGYGAALKSGLDYADADWVFITDADGTYPNEDLPRLLQEARKEHNMVVGVRSGPGISKSPLKRMARWLLRRMVQALTGVMVPDLNSGFRVFRHSLYREFQHLLPMGFSFTTTLTVASLYRGYQIKYIPIQYERRKGKSHIRPIRDFLFFSMLILRLASYFEPLRFFLPTSLILVLFGVWRGIRDIIVTNGIGGFSILLTVFAFQFFVLGILADVIVRRTESLSKTPPKNRFFVLRTPSEQN